MNQKFNIEFKFTFCLYLQAITTLYQVEFEILILNLSIFSVYGLGARSRIIS